MQDQIDYVRDELNGLVLGKAHLSTFAFERHFHLDYHVGLITEGVQRQKLNGKNTLLVPGTIQLMPPGEIHDGVNGNDGAYTLKTFRISQTLLCEVVQDVTGKDVIPSSAGIVLTDWELAAQLSRLHTAMWNGKRHEHIEIQSAWLNLLEQLLSRTKMVKPATYNGKFSPVQWRRIQEFCDAHLSEKITLDDLAAVCGLDRFQFLRLFKHSIGMTPHAWLVRLRLERACSLLNRSHQLTRVAQDVGFYDQSHFNRAFRRAFGVPPSQY